MRIFKLTVTALLFSSLTALPVSAQAQRPRTLEQVFQPDLPVEIVEMRIGKAPREKRAVKFKEPVLGGGDWLKGFAIKLKNTYEKPIVFISVELEAVRPGSSGDTIAAQIRYGKWPGWPGTERMPPVPAIEPGKSIELELDDKHFAAFMELLQKELGTTDVDNIQVGIGTVIFSDNLQWSHGQIRPLRPFIMLRRDLKNPKDAIRRNGRPQHTAGARFTLSLGLFEQPLFLKTSYLSSASLFPGAQAMVCRDSVSEVPVSCGFTNPTDFGAACTAKEDVPDSTDLGPFRQIQQTVTCYSSGTNQCSGNVTVTKFVYDISGICPDSGCGALCDEVGCTPYDPCTYPGTGCPFGYGRTSRSCCCPNSSPILVDVDGDGFSLTDYAGGTFFDLDGDGAPERLSWTAAGSDDAWLALDRDGDGAIEDGRELFGDLTPQPAPPAGEERNGFLALAEFDKAAKGGNADGVIDAGDAVFLSLRLWRDANHDGRSQPEELFTLPALDVVRLHLDYKESKRTDEHGNEFRYRAKLDDARGAKAGRWAWDVFLVTAP